MWKANVWQILVYAITESLVIQNFESPFTLKLENIKYIQIKLNIKYIQ